MNEKRRSDYKRNKQINSEFFSEDKNILNENNINNLKLLQRKPSKNSKPLFINNQNHIESINIINNNINYKNIILHNMLSPRKKYTISGKSSSSRNKKNNIKIEKNILYDYSNNNKNMQLFGEKKQKGLNKNITFKFMLNSQQDQDNYNINNLNLNDKEMKYKLKIYEKNNIINKLKDELEYYKSYYHNNINNNNNNPLNNLNIIIPDNNTINITSTNKKKIFETENIRNKIKNIFSLNKNEKNINIRKNHENNYNTLNNIFYRSNSNTVKRKLKLGLHPSELNLENNNNENNILNNNKYNSIDAERNNTNINLKKNIKNKMHSIYSLNMNLTPNDSEDNKFNYVENFDKLKKRMNNLVNNLFDLINKQYKK